MKRRSTFLLALLLVFGLVFTSASRGQTSTKIGPRLGIPVGDVSDLGGNFFLGGELRVDSEGLPVVIKPSVDIYLTDDFGNSSLTVFAIDLNAVYEFGVDNEVFTPYAGGGLAITRISVDSDGRFDPSSTDVGLNLVGGARFPLGSVEPFAELNFAAGADRVGITGGILFGL